MFKDILYLTLRIVQSQILDGHIMYLTSTLVVFFVVNKFEIKKIVCVFKVCKIQLTTMNEYSYLYFIKLTVSEFKGTTQKYLLFHLVSLL